MIVAAPRRGGISARGRPIAGDGNANRRIPVHDRRGGVARPARTRRPAAVVATNVNTLAPLQLASPVCGGAGLTSASIDHINAALVQTVRSRQARTMLPFRC
jgi:hypothetical protein